MDQVEALPGPEVVAVGNTAAAHGYQTLLFGA